MIYDSKETVMDVEGKLHMEEDALVEYEVDYDGFEEGKRYLYIPEGVKEIKENAFDEYNCSELVVSLSRNLIMPELSINEWAKRLSRRQIVKIKIPSEVGNSVRKKAEYMVDKERRIRFLRLHLPSSVESLGEASYPVLLEEITVDEKNPFFSCREGCLYSKDMKTLLRYPGYNASSCFEIPEGVECIKAGAFHNAFIDKLILPSTLRTIEENSFANTVIGELEILNGLFQIPAEAFLNCDIKKIILPESLGEIGNYAFKGTSGIQELICNSENISLGVGIFSKGNFEGIEWWPWEVIPKATFLNCKINIISIPEGVKVIEDYAFAGCFQAKEIRLAESVREIGLYSFDEGDTYCADVYVPRKLYKYVYRFPPLSKVNKESKSQIWNKKQEPFTEKTEILQRQKNGMERYVKSLSFAQAWKKTAYEKEIKVLDSLIKER